MNYNHLFFIIIPLSWSVNSMLIKFSSNTIDLNTLNSIRFLCIVPILFFGQETNDSLRKLFIISLFWFGFNFYFQGKALESNLDLGYFSIGTVTTSLFIMILSIITGLDTITRFQILGFTIVLSGFLLMFCENSQDTSKIAGLSYLLASNISISIGTVLLKKFNVAPTFTNISWMSLFSALFLLFTSVLENGIAKINYDISHLSIHSLMTILFSSYMITLLSGKMWVQVIRYFSPIMSSFSLFLTPIFSFLLASVFLKEITDYNKCISLILILFGILIATEIRVYPKKV